MLDRVKNLAAFLKLAKDSNKKFVLMLGAGASIGSGVKTTKTIMEELVKKFANDDSPGASQLLEDRFDQLWRAASPDARQQMLEPYLSRPPSPGYRLLVDLIRRGFFDVIITFNFDCVLEQAFQADGFTDYKTIIRGEIDLDAIAPLLRASEPRVKLLKMHGSLRSANYFLFSKDEMLNYPPQIQATIRELTGHDMLICGYAFNDLCVVRAFNDAKDAGSIHCVDPGGAPSNLKGYLTVRRSQNNIVSGELGKFDRFFEALDRELNSRPMPAPNRQNTFKFLDHYQEEHRAWFFGRRPLTFQIAKTLQQDGVLGAYLSGRSKVGKTSLLRAGLIPLLASRGYECAYVRCKADQPTVMRAELARRLGGPCPDWNTALTALTAAPGKPLVVILDQFEKTCRAFDAASESDPTRQETTELLQALVRHAGPRLRIVFSSIDEAPFWKLIAKLRLPLEFKDFVVEPLQPKRIAVMIRYFARRGGVKLDEERVNALCKDYEQSLKTSKPTFTLMHVQTICYYLMKGTYRSHDEYKQQPGLAAALDSIQEESNLIDLLDDLPPSQRGVLRSFLKIICDRDSNSRTIVEFIRDHFLDMQDEHFPEPLV